MSEVFKRSSNNPILKPTELAWENFKLYNPGCIYHEGKYHLFYRAMGRTELCSAIGHAASEDGENFVRDIEPVFSGEFFEESCGVEDPRLTKIGDTFYMAYTGYDGENARVLIATSTDLIHWQKHKKALPGFHYAPEAFERIIFDENHKLIKVKHPYEWSKSAAIFPEKINGKFAMLFGDFKIWLALSEDGLNWQVDGEPIMSRREEEFFDNGFVEMGPPPIRTEKGWLVLYHGISHEFCYRVGFALLDLEDPRKIIYRHHEAILEPREIYEKIGLVDVMQGGVRYFADLSEEEKIEALRKRAEAGLMPEVVFCPSAIVVGDELRIFYGAGDSVICTAVAKVSDILNLVAKND